MGEIALLYVRQRYREKGLHLGPNFNEKVRKTAEELGIPLEEAVEFVETLMREEFEKAFASIKSFTPKEKDKS